jgi:putative zinc finger/helix-turn-helix YgiT family protein
MTAPTCSNCGQPAEIQKGDFPFIRQPGLNVHLYDVDLIVCPECGNIDPVIPKVNEVLRKIAEAIVGKKYRMTGAEVRFLRKYLGMTAEQFCRLLHVDKTTMSKWENDEDPVGQQSDLLIRTLVLLKDETLRRSAAAPESRFPQIEEARRRLRINYDLFTGDLGYANAAGLVVT